MNRTRVSLLAVLCCPALVWGQVKVGEAAPDFAGTDIHGRTYRLSDFRGRVVVLEAYDSNSPFCAKHYRTGAMPRLQRTAASKGVIWLVVNSARPGMASYRNPEAARKEFRDLGMKATTWLDDSNGRIGRQYGLKTAPHCVVINQQGIVAYEGAIDDRPSRDGDPRTAHNYVRAAVEALLADRKVAVPQTKPYGTAIRYGQ